MSWLFTTSHMSMPTLPIMHTLAKHSPPSPQLTKGWRLVCFLRNFRNEGVGRFYGACPKPVRRPFSILKPKKCTFFTFFSFFIWRMANVRRNFAASFGKVSTISKNASQGGWRITWYANCSLTYWWNCEEKSDFSTKSLHNPKKSCNFAASFVKWS